jgi:prepilin-type N-terminal cleavage/methylation domain-containing protein
MREVSVLATSNSYGYRLLKHMKLLQRVTGVREIRAFTLAELLVVIAVIGILAALLLTAVSGVKQRSYETICLNNLRQIGIAMKLYHDENKGRFPLRISMRGSAGTLPTSPAPWTNWWDFSQALGGKDSKPGSSLPPANQRPLFPYVKAAETFYCRADQGWEDKPRNRIVRPSYWSVFGCSYTYNAFAPVRSVEEIGTTGVANKREESFINPTKQVLIYERPAAKVGGESPIILWHRSKSAQALFLSEHYAKGRELVAPFLFLDGHAQVLIFKNGEETWQSSKLVW